ncbi:putative protein C9orf4, partial [Ophiophagus hannah]
YPFPTAPPVDPFAKIRADDCGKTKGCFRYGKPGCTADSCDYFLSYRRIGADIEFELSAEADGWVAVGFSSDKKMGGDDVMACVHDDNGRVRIHHFYNVGQWAKEIQRNPARDEEGIFENNRVTCRFKRPVKVPRDETIVDLHLSWYYLFAWGPAIQDFFFSFLFVTYCCLDILFIDGNSMTSRIVDGPPWDLLCSVETCCLASFSGEKTSSNVAFMIFYN